MGARRGFSEATERVLPQLAARILSVPVVTAFVALGAVVLVGRSLKGVWSLLRAEPRDLPVVSTSLQQRERRAA
jgi:spore maturation protein SpmB